MSPVEIVVYSSWRYLRPQRPGADPGHHGEVGPISPGAPTDKQARPECPVSATARDGQVMMRLADQCRELLCVNLSASSEPFLRLWRSLVAPKSEIRLTQRFGQTRQRCWQGVALRNEGAANPR